MATLTIRNLPAELHEALKLRAKRNLRSLNQQVIAELTGIVERSSVDEDERKRQRVRDLIGKVDELRRSATGFMTAEEIKAAIEEGRA